MPNHLRVASIFAAALAFVVAVPSAKPAAAAPPARCADARYRQFDFWLGDWTVRDKTGVPVGHNLVTRELGGCAVMEHWQSLDKGVVDQTGYSYSGYDKRTKRWHQSWFDSFGNQLQLDGSLEGGAMLMTGSLLTPNGRRTQERASWTPLPGHRVRQFWDYSLDGGKTWTKRFEGFYTLE